MLISLISVTFLYPWLSQEDVLPLDKLSEDLSEELRQVVAHVVFRHWFYKFSEYFSISRWWLAPEELTSSDSTFEDRTLVLWVLSQDWQSMLSIDTLMQHLSCSAHCMSFIVYSFLAESAKGLKPRGVVEFGKTTMLFDGGAISSSSELSKQSIW